MATRGFKAFFDQLYAILAAAPELADDTGTNTKISVYKLFPENLIEVLPLIVLLRESLAVEQPSIRKFEDVYRISIRIYDTVIHDKDLTFARLDAIVRNVIEILKRNYVLDSESKMKVLEARPSTDPFGEYAILGWDISIEIRHSSNAFC